MSVYESLFAAKARSAPVSLIARAAVRGNPSSDNSVNTKRGVPCFTAGTLIRTPDSDVPIETLSIGDLVMTKDRGPQVLRWVGRTVVSVDPASPPVLFLKGALGNDRPLTLSPDHRVLLSGWRCAMVAGTNEVFAAARDLLNGRDILGFEGDTITYLHLAFDRHEIVTTAGLFSESFHPEVLAHTDMSPQSHAQIMTQIPDIGANPASYGPLVRPQVKPYEARLIRP